jgi:hypothetical protein
LFVLAACALLLVTALWFAARGAGDPVPSMSTRIDTPAQATEVAVAPPPAGSFVNGPSPVLERPRGDDEVQVCGLGWVRAQADGSIGPSVLEQSARVTDARARIVASLRADKSELSQAAGLWLSMLDAGADAAQIRNALAQAVLSSTDPRAYALGFNVCRSNQRNEGACQMLSASQWARLDPGNATPWLTLLSEAKARKDRAAEDEALHHIGTAQRSDLGFFSVPALAANTAANDDLSVLAAWSVAVEMLGHAAAWGIPSYQHVVAACKGAALADPNRRQTCSAIADVLTDRSNSFIDRMMGVAIGKQLGRPAERREWQSDEYSAYIASVGVSSAGRQSLACPDLRRGLEEIRRTATLGEIGALREWVVQSGKKPEDFAREARVRQTQQAREHARSQAASAPDDAAPEPRAASAAAPP